MDRKYAEYLLKKTKEDYNLIAEDYARTRHFTWDIENLAQYVSSGDKILDLGCGNGRLLEIFKDPEEVASRPYGAGKNIDYIGLDASEKLIEIARKNYPNTGFQVCDALNLSFPDNSFDKIFSIRVLPHIPSREFQLQFLKEAKRVLKPRGLLILTAWYLYGFTTKWKKNFLSVVENAFLKIIGKSELDFGDAFIPWDNKAMRYYHYFTKRELKQLIEESGFKIKKIWTTPFDIYLIAEKPS